MTTPVPFSGSPLAAHPKHYRADLHEAKDLVYALQRLEPGPRVRWLRLCCLKMSQGRIDVTSSTGAVKEVLLDFYSIVGQGALTLEWATALAEHMADQKDVRELFAGLKALPADAFLARLYDGIKDKPEPTPGNWLTKPSGPPVPVPNPV